MGPAINVKWVYTLNERAQNECWLFEQVRTLPHMNYIVLKTNMGTGVTVAVNQ